MSSKDYEQLESRESYLCAQHGEGAQGSRLVNSKQELKNGNPSTRRKTQNLNVYHANVKGKTMPAPKGLRVSPHTAPRLH